ncbi:MAG TPA: HoxN/HupN/NixA family nickel/cobalt transporter [Stellaceae bacterium]|nr:HoxN/HupN/NixA family nickel/cobalt transporter [Stellaceae bacterium]
MPDSFASAAAPRPDRRAWPLVGLYGVLGLANIASWLWAWTLFADRPALLGTAFLAWVFGLRHAVDADHIAAIDNAVRKLIQDQKPALSVGFFFSLGHSTVVVLAAAAIAASAGALHPWLDSLKLIGGTVGTAISAAFLLVIALVNLVIFRDAWRGYRRVAAGGALDAAVLDEMLAGRGLLNRLFRPLFRIVRRGWHLYPLGFLFGLGFDTATEIGLLGIAATQSAQGLSPWQTMVFPALFTAGMALIDTSDSVLMVGAYGWAFVEPLRKLWYNLAITGASVAVALLIGGVEALGLIADRLAPSGRFWEAVASLNDNMSSFGFAVIAIFTLAWGGSALLFRWRGARASG